MFIQEDDLKWYLLAIKTCCSMTKAKGDIKSFKTLILFLFNHLRTCRGANSLIYSCMSKSTYG